jgi:glycosyltransferase involved in cell wall biosynthesis
MATLHFEDTTLPMRARPLLTIGIPTWNRAPELRRGLDRIIPQVDASLGAVEVLVADNASTDATPQLLAEYVTRHDCIRYVRNAENIGGDRNYIVLLREARGTYMWLFSDDDFMTPGALAAVLDTIKRHSPALILTNFLYCNSQCQLRHFQVPQRHRAAITQSGLGLDQVFLRGNHWLSFISRIVFRRDALDLEDIETKLEMYRYWIQVYAIAQVARTSHNACLLAFDAVLCRTGDTDRGSPEVMYASMPKAFAAILRETGASPHVMRAVELQIRKDLLPLRIYALFRGRGAEDLPPVPLYYRAAYGLFGRSIVFAWKLYRWAKGRGFGLPPMY